MAARYAVFRPKTVSATGMRAVRLVNTGQSIPCFHQGGYNPNRLGCCRVTLASGSRLGAYEIVGSLGAGGMGEVYRALDTRLHRTVAIKVLAFDVRSDPERRRRFQREAQAVAALSHPHIGGLHDIGEHEGTDFLVLELVEGQTLAERLAEKPLTVPEALAYGEQIAQALDHAHRHAIVHRDLKPQNVMITKTGAKLLDFGLARLAKPAVDVGGAGPTGAATLTAEGTLLGTLPYMAPEQLEGREADARADIFAFGAVLYEMIAGRRAFGGTSPASIIGAVLKDEPPPLRERQSLTPPGAGAGRATVPGKRSRAPVRLRARRRSRTARDRGRPSGRARVSACRASHSSTGRHRFSGGRCSPS